MKKKTRKWEANITWGMYDMQCKLENNDILKTLSRTVAKLSDRFYSIGNTIERMY